MPEFARSGARDDSELTKRALAERAAEREKEREEERKRAASARKKHRVGMMSAEEREARRAAMAEAAVDLGGQRMDMLRRVHEEDTAVTEAEVRRGPCMQLNAAACCCHGLPCCRCVRRRVLSVHARVLGGARASFLGVSPSYVLCVATRLRLFNASGECPVTGSELAPAVMGGRGSAVVCMLAAVHATLADVATSGLLHFEEAVALSCGGVWVAVGLMLSSWAWRESMLWCCGVVFVQVWIGVS